MRKFIHTIILKIK